MIKVPADLSPPLPFPDDSATAPVILLRGRSGVQCAKRLLHFPRRKSGRVASPALHAAMKCPFCGYLEDKVVDSRESKEGEAIRRRRECLQCQRRFTTYERIDEIPTWW